MRLVLLHGFTQTGRSWDPLRDALASTGTREGREDRHDRPDPRHCDVIAPDAPGHGVNAGACSDLETTAAALAEELGPAVWIGYSMGGRLALHVALDHPEAVTALVLVSATAGIENTADRDARRRADEALARQIEASTIEAVIERWLAASMWATLPRERAGIPERLTNTPTGLAASLRSSGAGAQADLWPRLGTVTMPVLIVTGDLDATFTEIGDRMARAIPGAARARIPDAGHAVPWERPEPFTAAVHAWLSDAQGAHPR